MKKVTHILLTFAMGGALWVVGVLAYGAYQLYPEKNEFAVLCARGATPPIAYMVGKSRLVPVDSLGELKLWRWPSWPYGREAKFTVNTYQTRRGTKYILHQEVCI